MSDAPSWTAVLAARPGLTPADEREISALLSGMLAAARAEWPHLALDADRFFQHVADKVPAGEPLAHALSRLPAPELYLACACGHGDRAALAAFDRIYLQSIAAALAPLDLPRGLADEVTQVLRVRLLLGDQGHPKILDYSGTGDLKSWVRVAATRESIHLMRRTREERPLEDELADALQAPLSDPVLARLKESYRDEFRRALTGALAALTRRERNLLRQHYVSGMTSDRIARFYRVHRATAARWTARARERVLEDTRKRLTEQLEVPPAELESILRLIQSRLDVSVRRLLESR